MKFIKRLIILSGEKNKGTLTFERNAYGVFVKLNTYGAPIKDAYLSMVIDGKRFGNPATEAQFSLKGIDTVENVHAAVFAADKLVMYGTNESKRMPTAEIMRHKPSQKKTSSALPAKPRDVEKGEIFSGRTGAKRPQTDNEKAENIQTDSVKTQYSQAEKSKIEYSDDAIAESNYYPPLKEDIINVREKTRLKLFGESADDTKEDIDEPFDDNARAEILRRVAAAAQAGASPVIATLDSGDAQMGDMLKEFSADLNGALRPPQEFAIVEAENVKRETMQEKAFDAVKTDVKTQEIPPKTAMDAMQENAANWDEYLKQNKDNMINKHNIIDTVYTDSVTDSESIIPDNFKNEKKEQAYPCALAFSYIMNQSDSVKLSPITGDTSGADITDEAEIRMAENLKEVKKMIPDEKQNAAKSGGEKINMMYNGEKVETKEKEPEKIVIQKSTDDVVQPEKKAGASIKNKKSEKITPISGDKRVKARGGTFYERNGEEIERLFSGEREKELESLLPNSKWVKIDYNGTGKYYVIGLIGKEYLCYGVPAVYTPVPPKELNGYCWWFPLKPQEPQGKGYWIMYQNLTTGEAVFPPKE